MTVAVSSGHGLNQLEQQTQRLPADLGRDPPPVNRLRHDHRFQLHGDLGWTVDRDLRQLTQMGQRPVPAVQRHPRLRQGVGDLQGQVDLAHRPGQGHVRGTGKLLTDGDRNLQLRVEQRDVERVECFLGAHHRLRARPGGELLPQHRHPHRPITPKHQPGQLHQLRGQARSDRHLLEHPKPVVDLPVGRVTRSDLPDEQRRHRGPQRDRRQRRRLRIQVSASPDLGPTQLSPRRPLGLRSG